MTKFCILALIVVVVLVSYQGTDGAECCSAYTDLHGQKHATFLCAEYCCLDTTLNTLSSVNLKKKCCSSETLRVPSSQRTTECLKSWLSDHIWVPIVAVVVVLAIIIAIIVCCCCGCCICSGCCD